MSHAASTPEVVRTQTINRQAVKVYAIRGREHVVTTDPLTGRKYFTTPEGMRAFKTETSHGRFNNRISDVMQNTFLSEDVVWDSLEEQIGKAGEVLARAAEALLGFATTSEE